jgi:hypothetical protein
MMRRSLYAVVAVLVLALLIRATPGSAVVTVIASLGKEILQNVVFGSVKNEFIGSLSGMGCKGAALAGLISTASSARGGLPGAMIPGGQLPSAGGMGMGAARAGGVPSGAMPMIGMGAMDPVMMSQMAKLQQQMGGAMPGRPAMSPEQMAKMQEAMATMQGAMAQPLSREETMAVFDELAFLGLLTEPMRAEARDCIALAPPGAGDSIGVAGAMLKTMVLPALRQAKERMAALSLEEQQQLADGMLEALNNASPGDRKAFLEGFGAGFFPPSVVEQVRAKVAR